MAQLLLLVAYTARPGMREEFVQKVREAGILEAIRNENGCVRYDYFYSEEDENQLLLVEKWETEECQRVHMEQPHMHKLAKIKDRCMTDTKLERFLI